MEKRIPVTLYLARMEVQIFVQNCSIIPDSHYSLKISHNSKGKHAVFSSHLHYSNSQMENNIPEAAPRINGKAKYK